MKQDFSSNTNEQNRCNKINVLRSFKTASLIATYWVVPLRRTGQIPFRYGT